MFHEEFILCLKQFLRLHKNSKRRVPTSGAQQCRGHLCGLRPTHTINHENMGN